MNLTTSINNLSKSEDLLLIKIIPENLSLEAGFIIGLLYMSTKQPEHKMIKFKLFKILSGSNSSLCNILSTFIQDCQVLNFESTINDSEFLKCLPFSIDFIKSTVQEKFPEDDFIEAGCKFFKVRLMVIQDYSSLSFFGSGNFPCFRLAKIENQYFLAVEKESLAEKVIKLVNDLDEFSDRRKAKIKEIIRKYQGVEEECGHPDVRIVTLCGKRVLGC
jgi:hypothetical protein